MGNAPVLCLHFPDQSQSSLIQAKEGKMGSFLTIFHFWVFEMAIIAPEVNLHLSATPFFPLLTFPCWFVPFPSLVLLFYLYPYCCIMGFSGPMMWLCACVVSQGERRAQETVLRTGNAGNVLADQEFCILRVTLLLVSSCTEFSPHPQRNISMFKRSPDDHLV